jgi:hypothetical protein
VTLVGFIPFMESLCAAIRAFPAHLTDVGGAMQRCFPSGVMVWPGFLCSIMPPILDSRNRCDSFRRISWLESVRSMRRMDRREQSGRSGNSLAFCGLAVTLIGGTLIAAPLPALAVELSAPVAALYSTFRFFRLRRNP